MKDQVKSLRAGTPSEEAYRADFDECKKNEKIKENDALVTQTNENFPEMFRNFCERHQDFQSQQDYIGFI